MSGASQSPALRILGGLALALILGYASASFVAETWLAPRCAAYAAAHGIDYDGVLLSYLKKRKLARRISSCLFSDRTPQKAQVNVRWRELEGVPFLARLGADPTVMTLASGATLVAFWLTLTPGGVAYRRRRHAAGAEPPA